MKQTLAQFVALIVASLGLAVSALGQAPMVADGKARQFSRDIRLNEVVNHKWTDELVSYNLEFPAQQATLDSIRLYDVERGKELPFQLSGVVFQDETRKLVQSAAIAFYVDELPSGGTRHYKVLWDAGSFASVSQPAAALKETDLSAESFEVSNGLFSVRLAGQKRLASPVEAGTVAGPLRGFKGPDGVWRATSRFVTDARLLGHKAELVEQGPLWKLYRVRYEFDGERFYELELKMVVDHPFAYVTERNNFRLRLDRVWDVADQLRIVMRENFDPDRCFVPTTFGRAFNQESLTHDAVRLWTAAKAVNPAASSTWLGTYCADPQKNDMIAIVSRDAAHWEYPDASLDLNARIHFVDDPEEHGYFRIPVARAVRHWLLAVGDKRQWTQLRYPGNGPELTYPYLAHLRTKVCDLPLNKVKDWHLDWEQKLPGEPRLFFSTAQAEALHQRIEMHEPFKPYLEQVTKALMGGGLKTVQGVGAHDGGNLLDKLFRVGYCGFVQSISIARPMRGVAEALDYSARTLDPKQVAQTRREMAFLTCVLLDGDYWQASWNQGRTFYIPNFGSDLYIAVGMTALVLPDHPHAQQWMQYTLGELNNELTYYITEDGAGEENIGNYYLWTWRQLLPMLGALKHNGLFAASTHPKYQAACRFWIEILTPPQAKLPAYTTATPITREEMRRRIPPFGDWGFNNRECLELGGQTGMLRESQPQLAGESAWAWRQTSGGKPAVEMGVVPHVLIADPTVEPRVPVLQSRRLRGLGAILRNHFPSDKETFLAIKASRVHSHQHQDEGAVHLFGRGVPILLDGLHPNNDRRDELHPILSFADGRTHRRGEICEFRTSSLVDFVSADIPVGPLFSGSPSRGMTKGGNRRQVLLVKSPTLDVPDYFVLQDIVYGPSASQLNLPVFCGKPQPNAGGRANWVLLPPTPSPNYGVATDLIFLSPQAPELSVTQLMNGEGADCAWVLAARQPAGRNWAVVIYPRDKEMAAPTIQMLDTPNTFRLTSPGKEAVDYVVVGDRATSVQAEEFRFSGQYGVARVRGGLVSVSLVEGMEIRCQEIGVFGKGPVSLMQTARGFTGSSDGPARDIYLLLGREWTSDLVLVRDGKRERLNSPNGILALSLPEGHSEFTIEKP